MSRRSNGRHRRRGPLRRAAPAVATTAGSVALVTSIGTAAFWLVPGDQRVPFGGFGPGSTGAAPPTAELVIPTGTASTAEPPGSSDGRSDASKAGQPAAPASRADAGAAKPRQTSAGRTTSRPQATTRTPRPRLTTSNPPPSQPPLPVTTPPLVTSTPTLPFLPLPVSITASVRVTDLP